MSTPGEGQREAASDFGYWHELKTDPSVYDRVELDYKRHEIRFNDRNYAVGDGLLLRRTRYTGAEMKGGAPLEYTGHECRRIVTDVLRGPAYGLMEGWVIMSIRPIHNAGASVTEPASERPKMIEHLSQWTEEEQRHERVAYELGVKDGLAHGRFEASVRAGADVEGPACMGSHEIGPCAHPRHNPATGRHDLPDVGAPSAPAEPLELKDEDRVVDALYGSIAHMGEDPRLIVIIPQVRNRLRAALRAALSVSTSAPKETSEPVAWRARRTSSWPGVGRWAYREDAPDADDSEAWEALYAGPVASPEPRAAALEARHEREAGAGRKKGERR